jgi:hypothetical protein
MPPLGENLTVVEERRVGCADAAKADKATRPAKNEPTPKRDERFMFSLLARIF